MLHALCIVLRSTTSHVQTNCIIQCHHIVDSRDPFSSGCVICQNYMFSGESNTPPFFRRLKQIWKLVVTERLKKSQKHDPRAYLIVVGWRHMCVLI